MTGEKIEPPTKLRNVKWVRLVTDLPTVITEIFKGNMKLSDYINSMKGEKEFAVFCKDDPIPFFAEIALVPYLWIKMGILDMSISTLISGLVISIITLVPIGFKWELEQKVVIPSAILIGISSGILTGILDHFFDLGLFQILLFQVLAVTVISISMLLSRFFRDPERIPPKRNDIILTPADGKIIYVKKIYDGEIPLSEKNGKKFLLEEFVKSNLLPTKGYLIGIAMNFLDVHVNRAPIKGRITFIKHIKGLFISLKHKEAVIQNERVLTIIENKSISLGVVQIASRLVRKIVPYVKEGNDVALGQRIGMIRFGSQVDLVIPYIKGLRIKVKLNEKVKAGVSIIAQYGENQNESK